MLSWGYISVGAGTAWNIIEPSWSSITAVLTPANQCVIMKRRGRKIHYLDYAQDEIRAVSDRVAVVAVKSIEQ